MAIKPILYNTEMVRAILDGRKTCTRRIAKPQWKECPNCRYVHNEYIYDNLADNVYCAECGYPLAPVINALYKPGDILYVRETWHKYTKRVGEGENCHLVEFYGYKASVANSEDADEPWKPSIHMPKEAARIWLKVTDVRVERLQEITSEQICKEGVNVEEPYVLNGEEKRYAFSSLWNSTIKKSDLDRYGWNANPWVWVIEFERCEKPESCSKCKFMYEFQGIKKCQLMNVLNNGASKLSQNTFTQKRHERCPLRELPEKRRTIGGEGENDKLMMNAGFNACLDEIMSSKQEDKC